MFYTVQILLIESGQYVSEFSLAILQFDRRACLSSLLQGFNGLFLTLAQIFSLNFFSLKKRNKNSIIYLLESSLNRNVIFLYYGLLIQLYKCT